MKNVNSFKALTLFALFAHLHGFLFPQNQGFVIKDPFERRCFIENLGQFDEHTSATSSKILFGSESKGTQVFFTGKGFIFMHYEKIKRSRKEVRELMHLREAGFKQAGVEESKGEEEREKKELEYKTVPVYHEMQWMNSNTHAVVTANHEQTTRYLYPDKITKQTLFARGYQSIILHNVYQGIDVEVYFPNDRSGFKYNYIVRPGGNASLIAEKWTGVPSIKNIDGDLHVQAGNDDIICKKPYSVNGNKTIETAYQLNAGNVVTYTFKGKLPAKFILDPWVLTPVYTPGAGGFDVDFDDNGYTYVYGGAYPFKLNKYDNAGTLVWTYTTATFGIYYGDFAVDRTTGSVYITNGYCPASDGVIKLFNSGTFVASSPGTVGMNEMWRIGFSSCTNQAVIAGGGTTGVEQLCYLDTNLAGITSIAVIAPASPDIALLTIDNYGSCYILTAERFGGPGHNQLARCPLPAFLPVDYMVPLGTGYQELGSVTYVSANGFNGITVGDKTLFSYDGYNLKKLNSVTGVVLATKVQNPFSGTPTSMSWGGIAADNCKNVFLGDHDTVYHCDSNLVVQNAYPMPGTVIDVRISNQGVLYVTGLNFVQVLVPTGLAACESPINPNLSVSNATCYTTGFASVNPSGGNAPYTITWNTIPVQTGDTAFNLPAGTYTVTISDSSCNGNETTVTFDVLSGPGGITANTNVENASCNGANDGSITLDVTAGIAPFTYVWDTLGITDSAAAGLGAATYSITINDSAGCITVLDVVVGEPAPLTATTSADTVNCNGDNISLVCLPSGGTGPYTVLWNTSLPVLNDTLPVATAGVYSITVTDDNGCIYDFFDTLYEPAPLTLNLVTDSVGCNGSPLGSMVATVGGGTGPYDYLWSNNPSNNTPTNTGLTAGVYTLSVTDDNGCTTSQTDTVFDLDFPAISFTGDEPCNSGINGSITATATGGSSTTMFNYTWNTVPVQTGLTASNIGAGTYMLTISANGCSNTFPFSLSEDALVDTLKIEGVSCNGSPYVDMYLPAGAGPAYQWYLVGAPVSGQASSVFTVAVADAPNASATWFMNGCRYMTSAVEIGEYPVASKTVIPNIFTPNGDGYNNTFYAFAFIPGTDPSIVSYLFKSYHLEIYNRWGQLMFMSDDATAGWKGDDTGGAEATAGVYYVILKYEALCSDTEGEVIYKGIVQLVR
ncbi:MAG TPA: gliding motility-associated C-terminal domain-containing protein [Flavobacteriales bacterium]|nr:gliding motility-associated C-terminal domain-containing protein [Flavobacteriales bacterium]